MSELYRPGVKGCTDGNCMLVRNTGMVTNGGCQCESDIRRVPHGFDVIRTVHFLRNQLRDADAELERMRADLARVTAEREAAIVEAQQASKDRTIMKAKLDRADAENDRLREALIRLAAAADDVPLRFYPSELTEAIDQARAALNAEGEG